MTIVGLMLDSRHGYGNLLESSMHHEIKVDQEQGRSVPPAQPPQQYSLSVAAPSEGPPAHGLVCANGRCYRVTGAKIMERIGLSSRDCATDSATFILHTDFVIMPICHQIWSLLSAIFLWLSGDNPFKALEPLQSSALRNFSLSHE